MIGEEKKTFWDLLKKSNAFPIKWLSITICYVAAKTVVFDWNYYVSHLTKFPNVKKARLFGIYSTNNYDFEDSQWIHFRGQLLPLSIFFAIFLIFSNILKTKFPDGKRKAIFLLFELLCVYYIHGVYILWVILFLLLNYSLTYLVGRAGKYTDNLFICLTWVCPLALLFFNEYNEHWYSWITEYFPQRFFLDYLFKTNQEYRFVVGFNMMFLKMISFNLDYYLSKKSIDLNKSTKEKKDGFSKSESDYYFYNDIPSVDTFTNKNMKLENYTLQNYFIFCLYPPLYLAGPISSFNNFISWFNRSSLSKRVNSHDKTSNNNKKSVFSRYNIVYFFRFLVSFSLLELLNSKLYMMSIVQNYQRLPEEKVGVTGWLLIGVATVFFIHLKFNTMWKYFRLISLLDGVDVYENMELCVWGYTSIRAFWRDWHKSFYKWNLRYIYFFFGGKFHSLRNMILVFLFVAIWHDVRLNLLVYGWVIIFFFLFDDWISALLHKKFPKSGPNKCKWKLLPGVLRRLRIGLTSAMLIWTINIGFTGLGQAWVMLRHLCTLKGVHDVAIYVFLQGNVLLFSEIVRTFTGKKVIAAEY